MKLLTKVVQLFYGKETAVIRNDLDEQALVTRKTITHTLQNILHYKGTIIALTVISILVASSSCSWE